MGKNGLMLYSIWPGQPDVWPDNLEIDLGSWLRPEIGFQSGPYPNPAYLVRTAYRRPNPVGPREWNLRFTTVLRSGRCKC